MTMMVLTPSSSFAYGAMMVRMHLPRGVSLGKQKRNSRIGWLFEDTFRFSSIVVNRIDQCQVPLIEI